MTAKPERGYEKHAWILLFAVFAILFLRGLAGLFAGGAGFSSGLKNLTGLDWNQIVSSQPGFATFINGSLEESSLFLIGFSLLGMAIARTSYRNGERWAWYVSWYLAVWGIGAIYLVLTNAEGAGGPTLVYILDLPLLIFSLL